MRPSPGGIFICSGGHSGEWTCIQLRSPESRWKSWQSWPITEFSMTLSWELYPKPILTWYSQPQILSHANNIVTRHRLFTIGQYVTSGETINAATTMLDVLTKINNWNPNECHCPYSSIPGPSCRAPRCTLTGWLWTSEMLQSSGKDGQSELEQKWADCLLEPVEHRSGWRRACENSAWSPPAVIHVKIAL